MKLSLSKTLIEWVGYFARSAFSLRSLVLVVTYTILLTGSLLLAYHLRFDFQVPVEHWKDYREIVIWLVPFKLSLLLAFGQFSTLLTYFRIPDLMRILGAMTAAMIFLILMWGVFEGEGVPPRGVVLTDYVLSLSFLCSTRLALRLVRERYLTRGTNSGEIQLVAIVGTGDEAEALASDLLAKPGMGMRPVAFIDLAKDHYGKEIHGIPVFGGVEILPALKRRYTLDKLLLALPPSYRRQLRSIIEKANELNLPVEIIPSRHELATGKVKATQLRPVQFEDLLGRNPVRLDSERIQNLISGKVVCVTGAGGSIGSELCRQIAAQVPRQLILVDQSETGLFEIEQELKRRGRGKFIVPCVADITSSKRMEAILRRYEPELLFHAAAYKHVPMMEHQPDEAIRNNTIATAQLAELASELGIQRFVFISTDKAINPTSVMGATKRMAELYLQALQRKPGNACDFVAVRFGNVLGSSGSVIPTFKRQIAEGGPVTVTHPDVTRYFMTIPEAVGLVLESATLGNGADILVLDMGEPIKIVDVARELIRLSGLEPDLDIEVRFTGLRPGEKLYEELQHEGESFSETEHPSVVRFHSQPLNYSEAKAFIKSFEKLIEENPNAADYKRAIGKLVPEYRAYLD